MATELDTRVLEITIPEDATQTKRIMHANATKAEPPTGKPFDPTPFIALQRWLASSPVRNVWVPYGHVLMDLIPAQAVRMRRDSGQLITCIQAIALLHQCQRETRGGWLVATPEDYGHAYRLLAPIFNAVASEGLTPTIRQTIEAIKEDEEVMEADLVKRLKLAKSTVHYRVGRARAGGWLKNMETTKGNPARLRRAEPLPEEASALPTPEQLEAAVAGGTPPSTPPENGSNLRTEANGDPC
jgi:hypothetical protein